MDTAEEQEQLESKQSCNNEDEQAQDRENGDRDEAENRNAEATAAEGPGQLEGSESGDTEFFTPDTSPTDTEFPLIDQDHDQQSSARRVLALFGLGGTSATTSSIYHTTESEPASNSTSESESDTDTSSDSGSDSSSPGGGTPLSQAVPHHDHHSAAPSTTARREPSPEPSTGEVPGNDNSEAAPSSRQQQRPPASIAATPPLSPSLRPGHAQAVDEHSHSTCKHKYADSSPSEPSSPKQFTSLTLSVPSNPRNSHPPPPPIHSPPLPSSPSGSRPSSSSPLPQPSAPAAPCPLGPPATASPSSRTFLLDLLNSPTAKALLECADSTAHTARTFPTRATTNRPDAQPDRQDLTTTMFPRRGSETGTPTESRDDTGTGTSSAPAPAPAPVPAPVPAPGQGQAPTPLNPRAALTEDQVRALIVMDDDFDPIPTEYRDGFQGYQDIVSGRPNAQAQTQTQTQPQQPAHAQPGPRPRNEGAAQTYLPVSYGLNNREPGNTPFGIGYPSPAGPSPMGSGTPPVEYGYGFPPGLPNVPAPGFAYGDGHGHGHGHGPGAGNGYGYGHGHGHGLGPEYEFEYGRGSPANMNMNMGMGMNLNPGHNGFAAPPAFGGPRLAPPFASPRRRGSPSRPGHSAHASLSSLHAQQSYGHGPGPGAGGPTTPNRGSHHSRANSLSAMPQSLHFTHAEEYPGNRLRTAAAGLLPALGSPGPGLLETRGTNNHLAPPYESRSPYFGRTSLYGPRLAREARQDADAARPPFRIDNNLSHVNASSSREAPLNGRGEEENGKQADGDRL
ncbi:hypothetical protein A1O1_07609 [Capronia coronata CBS 617.96]|uniref:Uncharacterized protein n=1 Tax=Capronia coronata CBS 617.96 TaxID=1182541 RepID=W9XW20_9EURO|nr:uncharacterized protein A1O1_07609 [Capronia coronata CBS 617.96]EXJ81545.1 hypothetical protein A1O1_07609 [Capronia coronata CBS 617.96]